ncbi:MAG: hypothetical protein ACM3VS_11730 [Candidatus Dadabacteria bacterium]
MSGEETNVGTPPVNPRVDSVRADEGEYEGTDIGTGSQTPEGVTNPDTDIFDSGVAGGQSTDNGNAGS